MNIGICCYPSYGGSGVVATELGLQLAKLGHQVHFIAYNKPFRLGCFHPNIFFHEVESPNYPVFIHPPYLMAMANAIKMVDEYYSLDLLHAHYAVPHAMAIWLGRQLIGRNIPLVTTLHGTDVTIMGEENAIREAVAFSVLQSDAVTAVSDSLKLEAEKLLKPTQPIKRIYNFIEEPELHPENIAEIKNRLGVLPGDLILIHTSNFRPVKRIFDVVEVFKNIVKQLPAKLMLIGEGPELNMVRCKVKQYALEDHVLFLGKQPEVMDLLAIGDLFLLPSEKESFGLAALEAMACGLPVVATDAGGLPELILHGSTGFINPIGDIEGLTKSCLSILNNPELKKNMGSKARERALNVFNADKIIPEYLKLYESLVTRSKK